MALADGEYLISAHSDGFPLDRAVRALFDQGSWSKVRNFIRTGKIRVNGEVVTDPGRRVRGGDRVSIRAATPRARAPGALAPEARCVRRCAPRGRRETRRHDERALRRRARHLRRRRASRAREARGRALQPSASCTASTRRPRGCSCSRAARARNTIWSSNSRPLGAAHLPGTRARPSPFAHAPLAHRAGPRGRRARLDAASDSRTARRHARQAAGGARRREPSGVRLETGAPIRFASILPKRAIRCSAKRSTCEATPAAHRRAAAHAARPDARLRASCDRPSARFLDGSALKISRRPCASFGLEPHGGLGTFAGGNRGQLTLAPRPVSPYHLPPAGASSVHRRTATRRACRYASENRGDFGAGHGTRTRDPKLGKLCSTN